MFDHLASVILIYSMYPSYTLAGLCRGTSYPLSDVGIVNHNLRLPGIPGLPGLLGRGGGSPYWLWHFHKSVSQAVYRRGCTHH
ncbi:hypothetical protein BZA77DRAFT_321048, partial [Pyronema omphalodes]